MLTNQSTNILVSSDEPQNVRVASTIPSRRTVWLSSQFDILCSSLTPPRTRRVDELGDGQNKSPPGMDLGEPFDRQSKRSQSGTNSLSVSNRGMPSGWCAIKDILSPKAT